MEILLAAMLMAILALVRKAPASGCAIYRSSARTRLRRSVAMAGPPLGDDLRFQQREAFRVNDIGIGIYDGDTRCARAGPGLVAVRSRVRHAERGVDPIWWTPQLPGDPRRR